MIISVNWLKKFTQIDLPVDELAELIGARLVEIEAVEGLGKKYADAVVVSVVSAEKIKDTDRLNLVKIDDGGVVKGVKREDDGLVQVVCGAPNVRAGIKAVWLPPKSVVPATVGSAKPLILNERPIKGMVSHGMLASATELDLFDDHTGILEVDDSVKSGVKFADVAELDDYLLDVENKSLTHRPDTFGIIGFAREVSAIQGNKFYSPDWLVDEQPKFEHGKGVGLKAEILDHELSERYMAVVVDGVDVTKKSNLEIQTYLARSGVRPVNAAVDVTNYLMLLTGQPLHAFDYDKLLEVAGDKFEIAVRGARAGEKLELLDGRTIKLDKQDILIVAGDKPVALAGAIGGKATAVDENTKRILIESATFNLYNLRATQMRHGIFTEALTRFTKGQPANLAAPVLAKALEMFKGLGAKPASQVVDIGGKQAQAEPVITSMIYINKALGTKFEAGGVAEILEAAEFEVHVSKDNLSITAPYWRNDIKIAEDVIEEAGRLTGFDLIEPSLPVRPFVATAPKQYDKFKSLIRSLLVRSGCNEVLTYNFVHSDLIAKANQKTDNAYKIVNSISPDLQYYRQSLAPSLLNLVNMNIRQGFLDFALFEINKTHLKSLGLNEEGVPHEQDSLGFVIASRDQASDSPYYRARFYVDYIAKYLGVELDFKPLDEFSDPVASLYQPGRAAVLLNKKQQLVGVVGEYQPAVKNSFKLPDNSAGFEIKLDLFFELFKNSQQNLYKPLSRYQSSDRDICFKVESDITYQSILDAIKYYDVENTDIQISPVDIYQPENGESKNITIKVSITPYGKTLDSQEIQDIVNKIANEVSLATAALVV